MLKKILVVGGAGFIGSHVNKLLNLKGFDTVVLDNLSTGSREAVVAGTFVQGDFGDKSLLKKLFQQHNFDAAIHFAALTDVGESIRHPNIYYSNNVVKTLALLDSMIKREVKALIFSSSAAVYGIPQHGLVKETDPLNPINPYGQTKAVVENILKDYDRAFSFKSCSLRYFNAAGGDPQGEIKNRKKKENNLIPIVLRSLREEKEVTIFGTDYPTPDGTCIRDYVHVMDLAEAHILALEKLLQGGSSSCYNLGNGRGYSVKEVIQAAQNTAGQKVIVNEGPRRPGDPPILMADSEKAKEELGWRQKFPDLKDMIRHAWLSYDIKTREK